MLSMHDWIGRQGRQIQKRLIVVTMTAVASAGMAMLATADAPRAGEGQTIPPLPKGEEKFAIAEISSASTSM